MRVRLLWQLLPSYLLVILLTLFLLSWLFTRSLSDFYLEETAADLEARARLAAVQIAGRFDPLQAAGLDPLSVRLGEETGTRFTFILPSGEVLADSLEEPERMENHAGRQEVAAALAGEVGRATRYSDTMEKTMMFVAVPVRGEEDEITGIVRAALPVTAINRTLHLVYQRIVLSGALVMLLAAAVSVLVGRRISRPLEAMRLGAERFARGDFSERLSAEGAEEIGALAAAMNSMVQELDERMRTMVRQHSEQEAVLSSMVEGVLAVDTEERILRINRAAAALLGVRPDEVQGRRIEEAIRKADLQRFVTRALNARNQPEGKIVLHDTEDLYLQAHCTVLRGEDGEEFGALVVLNDITRLRRLENVRRDFVANVSHELKTPITAIKGFVETLQDVALEDPDHAQRFLEIIVRQADRLNAIVDDLLALSRIEQGVEQGGLPLTVMPLRPVLEAAIQGCTLIADEKEIKVNLFCSSDLAARINAPLLEQAVVNLLTNAIKYSHPQGKIAIEAARWHDRITIRVQDWGCGIEKEHLPRLFERFYRVDKARSRAQGGTGLGLAIVKHIVQAHGGEVVVHSTPGHGSTFSLHLPLRE
jgi:two-component system, OmpR family, phosphate regulon sensor histidine kinase PhoR